MGEAEREALLASLIDDYTTAELSKADKAMLDYAIKLTRTPAAITAHDIESLRAQGFDDRMVHDICAITAYFAFVNRIADGLGVQLETP